VDGYRSDTQLGEHGFFVVGVDRPGRACGLDDVPDERDAVLGTYAVIVVADREPQRTVDQLFGQVIRRQGKRQRMVGQPPKLAQRR